MFKVGDRVIPNDTTFSVGDQVSKTVNRQQISVVTELTEHGFKWKLEGDPICIHPFYGSYSQGECLMPKTYRLAHEDEKPILTKDILTTFTST
jgi:hypothetical protein